VVLDANFLISDWKLQSLAARLLRHMTSEFRWKVAIPRVALLEASAKHKQAVRDNDTSVQKLLKDRRRLGVSCELVDSASVTYIEYLDELLEEKVVGFEVLPLPNPDHATLVKRAIERVPPFNEKGSGYRDSLIWENVKELAAAGNDVAFVTWDKVFAGSGSELADSLKAEVAPLVGNVVLVENLGKWLIEQLPWESQDLSDAVAGANSNEFHDYLMKSDILENLEIPAHVLNVPHRAVNVRMDAAEWDFSFERVSQKEGPGGSMIIEFDVGLAVSFRFDLLDVSMLVDGVWKLVPQSSQRYDLERDETILARMSVLFDADGFWIDEILYRPISASNSLDYSLYRPHQDQISLFDG
jgi:hypothetical protein